MSWTGRAKWENTDDELRIYCGDDEDRRDFRVKWDDTNNRLEIHQAGEMDEQIKWQDSYNKLIGYIGDDWCDIDGGCCGYDCDIMPRYVRVVLSGIENCGSEDRYCYDPDNGYLPEASSFNGTYILEHLSDCIWRCDIATNCNELHLTVQLSSNPTQGDTNGTVSVALAQEVLVLVFSENISVPNYNCDVCDDLPRSLDNGNTCRLSPRIKGEGKNGTATVSILDW
jgi:hypothetical protein